MTEKFLKNLDVVLAYIGGCRYVHFASLGVHVWGQNQVLSVPGVEYYRREASSFLNRLEKAGFIRGDTPCGKQHDGREYHLTAKGEARLAELFAKKFSGAIIS